MKKLFMLILLSTLCFAGCTSNKSVKTEKTQTKRDRIINVKNDIVDIKTEIIFGKSLLYIIDDFLVLSEVSSKTQKCIHLFDKNTFRYITSTGVMGRGPGEISEPGNIGVDRENKILWVPDYGNKVIWKFPLDSVLNNKAFMPSEKLKIRDDLFIERFDVLNDSIFVGKAVQFLENNLFSTIMSTLNIRSNVIQKFGYVNPKIDDENTASQFALSLTNNIYVNSYFKHDLITICSLDGNLLYNVYGPDGLSNKGNKKSYFFGLEIFNNKIVASYINDVAVINEGKRPKGNIPSKLLVFDTQGNYSFTIDTGDKFTYFCVDEENNRIIAYFEGRREALGYFTVPSFTQQKRVRGL